MTTVPVPVKRASVPDRSDLPCVWLYFRFPFGSREVEEPVPQRGVIVSRETARRWCMKFGQAQESPNSRDCPMGGHLGCAA